MMLDLLLELKSPQTCITDSLIKNNLTFALLAWPQSHILMKVKLSLPSCCLYFLIVSVSLCLAIYLGLNQNKSPATHSESLSIHEVSSPLTTEMTTPLKDGSGSFKHYNTVAPKEEKVFPLLNNTGKTAIVTGALPDTLVSEKLVMY